MLKYEGGGFLIFCSVGVQEPSIVQTVHKYLAIATYFPSFSMA